MKHFESSWLSFLCLVCLFSCCLCFSSCSSSDNDDDSNLTGFEEAWEKVTGLSSSGLGEIKLLSCDKVEYLPYEDKDYSVINKSAFVFSGIKNNKLWLSVYEPNVFDANNRLDINAKDGFRKVLEWSDSKEFDFNKRLDKYTTISVNNIICQSLVLKKDGFAVTIKYEGKKINSPNDEYSNVTFTKFVKNGVVKDSLDLALQDLYPWSGDSFVNRSESGMGEIINIDGSTPHIYFNIWVRYWEAVAMYEVVWREGLGRTKLRFEVKNLSLNKDSEKCYIINGIQNDIWIINDKDVAKKLNVKLGDKDRIEYQLLKKVDEHTWKYKAHVVYEDWDTPDADYEILVDIDKGELK